jgi:NADP-dependent 3-hydroxy acid dehydrogenase YdfG
MCEASVGLCATFAPTMAERGTGGILIVASLAAFQPLPNTATYGACKAFLLEGLARNRRVILPGAVVRALAASGRYCPHALQLPLMNRAYRAKAGAARA